MSRLYIPPLRCAAATAAVARQLGAALLCCACAAEGFLSPSDTGAVCGALVGDLVISELMVDPAGSDGGREWVEIYNASSQPQWLNRLVVWVRSDANVRRFDVRAGGQIEPWSYVVLGGGERTPGFVDYIFESYLGLDNASGNVELTCGPTPVDCVSYGAQASGTAPQPARTLLFDGALRPDAISNDRVHLWCNASEHTPYDDVNSGTPGAPNEVCDGCFTELGAMRRVRAPAPGDLVITEVFADPRGADANREWLELYVAASHPVDLNGLTLVNTADSGSERRMVVFARGCQVAQPGTFVVVGVARPGEQMVEDTRFDVVVNHGSGLFNGPSALRLTKGDVLIDAARLPDSDSGIATNLDRELVADATANDSADAFCAAQTKGEFGENDEAGTPGAVNDVCGNKCLENEIVRQTHAPKAGDLVITEFMANPSGSDNSRDWLELYVSSTSSVDINGLRIESSTANGSRRTLEVGAQSCLRARPGELWVIGGIFAADDGVVVDAVVSGPADLLYAASGFLSVYSGDTLVDVVPVAHAEEHASWSYGPWPPSADDNNDPARWCISTTQNDLAFSGKGSPGEINEACLH